MLRAARNRDHAPRVLVTPPVAGHAPSHWSPPRSLGTPPVAGPPVAGHIPNRCSRPRSLGTRPVQRIGAPDYQNPAQPNPASQPQPAQPSPAQPNPAYNPRLEIPSQLLIALGPWLPTPEDPMWTHGGRNCDSTWLSKPGTIHNTTQEHTANATQNCAVSDIPSRGRRMAEGPQISKSVCVCAGCGTT